ncbi:MAG TPA: acetolactate synthase [Lachnospiraceae bacterium]|nr:thiamine pyrophosphate-binding protein [Clostridium sp. AM42-36]HCS95572.1 acetolactate synthase [Lachnospiraceae bacterium]
MKVKIADWIAQYLVDYGIKYNFTVPGGGAMHLNVAFGHQEGLNNIFVQHEQSAAIAAEGYFRATNELPMVCCTTGPGGTNTLTGVLGAWLDSIPMLIISGQVRYATTARAAGIPVRAMGDQEYDITPMVAHMTKYAEMIIDPKTVKYHLQKALYLATTGRPGPVWLDVPLDVQGGYIDPEEFIEFDPNELKDEQVPEVSSECIEEVITRINNSQRPVLYVGSAIHSTNTVDLMRKVADKLGIPVVVAYDATDLMPYENDLYAGIGGLLGDRGGNWTVQNSDLILSVGCRLSCRQVGYNVKSWAREAYVMMVDIDKYELIKPSIHVEMPIHADAKDFLEKMDARLTQPLTRHEEWLDTCRTWKKNYPVVTEKHYKNEGLANAYCFLNEVSRRADEDQYIVLGNGTVEACLHAIYIKEHTRLLCNSGAASMGYDLPAAIGCCFAIGKKNTICLTGDGSIQMNLQELQTIVFHKLPIKIFVVNNQGYHSMRQTEGNLFPEYTKVGVGPESGDLSFPEMKKIAGAYGIPYMSASSNAELPDVIEKMLHMDGYAMCEVFVDINQKFEPKSATKKLADGTLVSPPLEDLAPFLPREELEKIMIIPMWKE